MCKWLATLALALVSLCGAYPAAADDYPARPVTMIVPFPAGGATDTLARFLGGRPRIPSNNLS